MLLAHVDSISLTTRVPKFRIIYIITSNMFACTAADLNGNCTTSALIWLPIATIITSKLIITALFCIYKFIKHFGEEANKISRLLYHSGNAFFVISVITLILAIPIDFTCSRSTMLEYWDKAFQVLYGLQCYLLLLVWFIRLYYAFNNSQFKLSRCTVMFIIISAIIGFIGLMYCLLFHDVYNKTGFIILTIFLIAFVAWMIFLVALFIYKLVQVYKSVSVNSNLIRIITKITILSVMSIFFTVVHCIMVIITAAIINESSLDKETKLHLKMIGDFIHLINIFMNFICILLSYNCFDADYKYICGGLSDLCTNAWHKCIGNHRDEDDFKPTRTSVV